MIRATVLLLLPFLLGSAPSGNDPICVKMVTVTANRIRVPHLKSYRDSRIVQEVNRQIDEEIKGFGCAGPGEVDKTLEVRTSVKLAAQDILSVYISGSYFCGAYPENDSDRSMTFDLRTGRQISFEELFQDFERDKKAILTTLFAKQIAAAEQHPQPEVLPDDVSCEESPWLYALDALEASTYTFNLSDQGLEVQPDWPHVVEACQIRDTVPYSALEKLAAPGGLLVRMRDAELSSKARAHR